MKLWVLSLNFKHADLDTRAKACLQSEDQIAELTAGLEEYVWLSTCNRLELYGTADITFDEVLLRWLKIAGLDEEHSSKFQTLSDLHALTHLFRVTASLESMVLGENQIHGQVKKAYLAAQEKSSLGPVLHRCFQAAFRASKRIKSETEVGQFTVSVPSVGVKLAQKLLGSFQDKTVGIIGTGEIGRVAAEHFGSIGPKKLLLHNRTRGVAEEFAKKLKIECVPAEVVDLEDLLEQSHIIVSAVSTLILGEPELQMLEGKNFPPFILDLSVPPSVANRKSEKLFIYRVDDLQRIANENSKLRQQELERASVIVFEEAEKCWRSFESVSLGQTFERLSEKVSLIRDKEIQALRRRLPHLSEKDWFEIEKMSERLSEKIVQDPVIELRLRLEADAQKETWLHFFRNMFRI